MLQRTAVLTFALLLAVSFAALADGSAATDLQAPPAGQLCPLPGAPDQAPAELDLDDPATDFQHKIRICEDDETIQHCGSLDCNCVFISNRFRCFC